jgi:hypothetical protein
MQVPFSSKLPDPAGSPKPLNRNSFDLSFVEPWLAKAPKIDIDALRRSVEHSSALAKEQDIIVAKAMCLPASCATCEGAALCGIVLN